uniref:Uncharacterized protein n=1 Tax=Spongospora subterranea TaxID=70186 RepID=A0A0H5QZU9_9EUKA|eukprot:CRZ07236.1 hypothetical protein [Spongospora subterranea]
MWQTKMQMIAYFPIFPNSIGFFKTMDSRKCWIQLTGESQTAGTVISLKAFDLTHSRKSCNEIVSLVARKKQKLTAEVLRACTQTGDGAGKIRAPVSTKVQHR